MFDQLIDDHNAIRGIIASLRDLLVEDGIPIGRCSALSRWALTRHLFRLFASENLIVRDHPAASLYAASPVGADAFEERYRRHVGDWTPDRIDNEWPQYCRELHGILNSLERRMVFEEAKLYPALGRAA